MIHAEVHNGVWGEPGPFQNLKYDFDLVLDGNLIGLKEKIDFSDPSSYFTEIESYKAKRNFSVYSKYYQQGVKVPKDSPSLDYLVTISFSGDSNVGFSQEIYSFENIEPDSVQTIKLQNSPQGVYNKAYFLIHDSKNPGNKVSKLDQIDSTSNNEDIIFGDDIRNNEINAGKGGDIVFGQKDNDKIRGGAGNDALIGGEGNDSLYGDNGDDFLDGGIGDDDLQGLQGNDSILGEAGNDRLRGGSGNDTLDGGIGNDRFAGYTGNDSLIGGAGNDLFEGGSGNDTLLGDDGNDRLRGGDGNDSLNGGNGADVLEGGNGADNFVFKSSYHDGIDKIIDFDRTEGDKIQVGFGGGHSQFDYDISTGGLFFDASSIDGIPAIQFAALLPNTDFEASRDIVFI